LKRALKSELKRRSVARTGKKPRLVMTRCFGIRPKHAVVLASAATLNRGEIFRLRMPITAAKQPQSRCRPQRSDFA
jgi:hypothetical protein